jgi:hypothetical protein
MINFKDKEADLSKNLYYKTEFLKFKYEYDRCNPVTK